MEKDNQEYLDIFVSNLVYSTTCPWTVQYRRLKVLDILQPKYLTGVPSKSAFFSLNILQVQSASQEGQRGVAFPHNQQQYNGLYCSTAGPFVAPPVHRVHN